MLRVIDVVYYNHNDLSDPQQVIDKHQSSTGYAFHLKAKADLQFIKHAGVQGGFVIEEIKYVFFKRSNSFWQIPFKTHRYIKAQDPNVVIIEGLIFPIQLIALKMLLAKKCRIIVQHHGVDPYGGIKGFFQKQADRFVDKYLFSSVENAKPWVDKGIIRDKKKICEVNEGSSSFVQLNKEACRKKLQIPNGPTFLWVGRLDSNKDPVTVLRGFLLNKMSDVFKTSDISIKLYMIFQTTELLPEITTLIKQSEFLQKSVSLIGPIPHADLQYWYSASDYFITGSHQESGGFALIEAMACGCIPVVTNIPSYAKITANAKFGFLYDPGDADGLMVAIEKALAVDQERYSEKVVEHFNAELSFKKIADDLYKQF